MNIDQFKNNIKTDAFMDELEKVGAAGVVGKVLSKVLSKGSRKWVKDAISYGGRNTVRSNKIGKHKIVARAKQVLSKGRDKKLTSMQKRMGGLLFKGKQAVTQPMQFLKDDYTRNVKYFARDMKKVKGGKYTTMFGNKRNVIGYSGGKALIERKLPAKVLGATITAPGIAALTLTEPGKGKSKARRGVEAVGSGLGWSVAPTLMLGGMVAGAAGKASVESIKARKARKEYYKNLQRT